jgi:hypothetical protein
LHSHGTSRLAFDISYSRLRQAYGAASCPRPREAVISSPLAPEDLARLIADALHCEPERVTPLAQLVTDSTWQDREGEQSN